MDNSSRLGSWWACAHAVHLEAARTSRQAALVRVGPRTSRFARYVGQKANFVIRSFETAHS